MMPRYVIYKRLDATQLWRYHTIAPERVEAQALARQLRARLRRTAPRAEAVAVEWDDGEPVRAMLPPDALPQRDRGAP